MSELPPDPASRTREGRNRAGVVGKRRQQVGAGERIGTHEERDDGPMDAELAAVVEAWPGLPRHVRAAVLALLAAANVEP